MKIRKATIKDVAIITRINTLSEDPTDNILGIKESWVKNHFKNALQKKKLEVFLYENKGVAAFNKEFCGYKNSELHWLTVDKNYQRQGIATKLVKYVEDYARKLKFKGLYSYTHPKNKRAINLYRKLGFQKINEFPHYYSNGDKSILMGKLIK